MPILVTGGAGYIGSHMDLALQDIGEEIVVFDNLSTGFRISVPKMTVFEFGDIGDVRLLSRIIRKYNIETIIHFAGKSVVPESLVNPLNYYEDNAIKSHALIECAVREGIKYFIFSSTAAVYGNTSNHMYSESDLINPISPYGRSKVMIEWMLEDVCRVANIKYAILRYFNVAGADPKGRSGQSTANATHLIKAAVQAALGVHDKLAVFGSDYSTPDGTCIRDYIQVTDLCQVHIEVLKYFRLGGQSVICNCGYGSGYSVLQIISAVKRVSGINFPVEFHPRRAGDLESVVANNTRLKALVGWSPKYNNLECIVAQAFDWEKHLIEHPLPYS
jgi:UDP-glucose 4-epimerase